jgi:hypothetical protein
MNRTGVDGVTLPTDALSPVRTNLAVLCEVSRPLTLAGQLLNTNRENVAANKAPTMEGGFL